MNIKIKNRVRDAFGISAIILPTVCGIIKTTVITRVLISFLSFFVSLLALLLYDYIQVTRQVRRMNWSLKNLNYDYVCTLSFKTVDRKYCLNYEEDSQYVFTILNEFNTYFQSLFWNNKLLNDMNSRTLSDIEYVMLNLFQFLNNFDTLYTKIGDDYLIEYSATIDSKSVYYLTDRGFTFYRLLYTTAVFCSQSKKICKTASFSFNTRYIQNTLDNGQVQFH